MDVVARVTSVLEGDPAVRAVRLVGSRARGAAGDLSDWDFEVDTADFDAVARDLPALVSTLQPLAQQWDRLARQATYMVILRGPIKVDLLFDKPHDRELPWGVSRETLENIDCHFWDWILWLASKRSAGKSDLMRPELAKMHDHLLQPMGVEQVPETIEAAVKEYQAARRELEARFNTVAPKELEREIVRALRKAGYAV